MISARLTFDINVASSVNFETLVYFPVNYDDKSDAVWPVILFLHGKDERGGDIALVKREGLPKYLECNDIPFIVVAPQCSQDTEWVFCLDALAILVNRLADLYNVDRSKLYLTGISMGAVGAWHLGIKYPRLFSAIVPICGGTYPFLGYPEAVTRLKNVPVWVFHGRDDNVMPIWLSEVMVDKLKEAGANIRYTWYENTGHDAWTKTYSNKNLYEWLLQQSKL